MNDKDKKMKEIEIDQESEEFKAFEKRIENPEYRESLFEAAKAEIIRRKSNGK